MKSKIVALSRNQDFKNLLKERKISNKYLTIYFGKLSNKDNKKLNISFKKYINSKTFKYDLLIHCGFLLLILINLLK